MNRKQRRAAEKRKAPAVGTPAMADRHKAEGRAALLTLGQQLHAEGRLEAADRYYVQALQADPNDAEALRLRGALAHQIGNHAAAVELLKRAAARLPRQAELRLHLAAALEALDRRGEAERVYRKAMALAPDSAEAQTQFAAFLRTDPARAGWDEAERLLRRVLDRDPTAAAAGYHLSALLIRAGRAAEALPVAEAASAAAPDDLDVLIALGVARQHAGDLDRAEDAFREVDRRAPGNLGAAINLASLLIAQDRAEEAEGTARAALARDPDSAPAMLNLGVVLASAEAVEEAEALYRRVLEHAPDHADAWGNYANLLRMAGRHEEALDAYDRALALRPDDPRARFQKGMGLLALGRLAEGWRLYEAGFPAGERRPDRPHPAPRWHGEALAAGDVLHIWPEQGVGDEIRFLSLAAEAAERAGARTIVECDARLVPLLRRSVPAVEAAAPKTEEAAAAEAAASAQIPMASLPAILRPDIESFPARPGWLTPDPRAAEAFAARLDALGPGLKVGIAWTSGLDSLRRRTAHGALMDWASILTMDGVRPVSLQYGDVSQELRAVEAETGVAIARWDDLDLKNDLDRTAALISRLDLVIATGSSVGDLAGATGAPLWSLLRPRDWVTLGQDHNPWIPQARVFFRRPGEGWARLLVEEVAPALARLRDRRS
ncbi:MAG: tetratricopeptide repeat protein [Alphaproteobacteria bacterium]|nr:tetratricopeptide repeat protein [Alphaproteobacteria bacterium]